MRNLEKIYKPKTIGEAVTLLSYPNTRLLAGGTGLLAHRDQQVAALIDLSGLGLGAIQDAGGATEIGATATLADIVDSPILRAVASGAVAEGAHRSASSLLRNQGTAAGTIIVEPDGILATVLCALDGRIRITKSAEGRVADVRVDEFLSGLEVHLKGGIVTCIVIPAASTYLRSAIESVARTPRDKPIVTVCAARDTKINHVTIAVGGVSDHAVRASIAENIVSGASDESGIDQAARAAMELNVTHSDFRGSSEYRREMVGVLVRRALARLYP